MQKRRSEQEDLEKESTYDVDEPCIGNRRRNTDELEKRF